MSNFLCVMACNFLFPRSEKAAHCHTVSRIEVENILGTYGVLKLVNVSEYTMQTTVSSQRQIKSVPTCGCFAHLLRAGDEFLVIRDGGNYLHTSLSIMKVEDIHKNNVPTFVNMCLMGKCPEIFNPYYQVKTTPYETRQEGSLDIYRIQYGARAAKIVAVKLYNSLEKDLDKY